MSSSNNTPRSLSFGSRLFSSSNKPASSTDFVTEAIANNKVVIFSKSYCPFCRDTKQLFDSLGELDGAVVYELDEMGPEGGAIQQALAEMSGQRTVPNTFVHGQHVGGNDKVQALARTGELQKLLQGAE